MKREIAIPLFYLLAVSTLLGVSILGHAFPAISLIPYGLTLPWSFPVGLLVPNVWVGIPITVGGLINAGMIYGFLANK